MYRWAWAVVATACTPGSSVDDPLQGSTSASGGSSASGSQGGPDGSSESGSQGDASTTAATTVGTTSGAGTETEAETGAQVGFEIVEDGAHYIATSYANPDLSVEIDCDDVDSDGHYFSITPVIDGRRLEGPLWDSNFGLIVPDFDAGQIECISVQNVDERLVIDIEAGSYMNLDGGGPDQPVPLLAEFFVDDDLRLHAELSGIYYILPTTQDTVADLTFDGGMTESVVVTDPPQNLTVTYDAVTFIDVSDSLFGHFTIETSIDRLQVQIRTVDPRFEFDLDHSFKELGQQVVNSHISFD
jgi:hypothetical protein